MAGFSVTRRISAPVEEVFAAFADFARAADRIESITELEVLTDGPIGVGTRFRETRTMFGKQATEELEITGFEPNQSYTVECTSHGAHYVSVYTFEPEHDGTNVSVTFDATPLSLFAKLTSPLAFLMVKTVRSALSADIDDLEKHLGTAS